MPAAPCLPAIPTFRRTHACRLLSSITAVVPLYNHESWLPRCVASLLGQTRLFDEIIIVNDGSDDRGGEIADAFAARHDHIRVIHHGENSGAPKALNTGLEAATSDWVLFSAADDMLLPDLAKRALNFTSTHPDIAIYCGEVALIDVDDHVIGIRPTVPPSWKGRVFSPVEVRSKLRESDYWIVGSSTVYRRDKLHSLGGFDVSIGSHTDGMISRLMALQEGFYFDPQIVAAWRFIGDSISNVRTQNDQSIETTIKVATAWIERHGDIFPDNYADLYARRYRVGAKRIQIRESGMAWPAKLLPLARLYLEYRPMALSAFAAGFLRSIWLSSRQAEVETVLRGIGHKPDSGAVGTKKALS